jgi:hypothetical protein
VVALLANETVHVNRAPAPAHLSAEQTQLVSTLSRTPNLYVVVKRVLDTQNTYQTAPSVSKPRKQVPFKLLTFALRYPAEVEVDDYALGFIVVGSLRDQDKLATCLGRHRQDALDPQVVIEGILAPCQAFVRAVDDVVRSFFIVDQYDHRARITVFPQVRVFVNLFPRLASVPCEENVTLIVWQQ